VRSRPRLNPPAPEKRSRTRILFTTTAPHRCR
jgi:hypothetical protein